MRRELKPFLSKSMKITLKNLEILTFYLRRLTFAHRSKKGIWDVTLSYLDWSWNFHYVTFWCTIFSEKQTGKQLSELFLNMMWKCKFGQNFAFITTDLASNANIPVKISSSEEDIIVDIQGDPRLDLTAQSAEDDSET